jgi:hypothetical protein
VVLEVSEPLLHVLGLVAVLDGDLEHLDEPVERVLVHRTDVRQTLNMKLTVMGLYGREVSSPFF